MSYLVPSDEIEQIVGATRHPTAHLGRAVSAEEVVYILHSHECRNSGIDLRRCPFSVAMDRGIDLDVWPTDTPVRLTVDADGFLIAAGDL